MVRPVNFYFNAETAKNNFYQKNEGDFTVQSANELAEREFDDFLEQLQSNGINVIVVDDLLDPETPDSIFPNNWVSFHQDGRVGLYPMFAENRRLERRTDILEMLRSEGYEINEIVDLTEAEEEGRFLEGTGSMVLDRVNKLAYAALSLRTDKAELEQFCDAFGYEAVPFVANQSVEGQRLPIYHTNVMMHVGDKYAVLCADTIDDKEEKNLVISKLEKSGKEVILISEEQKNNFAGNMLQLNNHKGEKFTIMSTAAYNSLDVGQLNKLKNFGGIIHSSLTTIEQLGGGSARCMMAEMFLPQK
ncbi:MAG: hypothetical protein ACI8XB_000863 [Patiriisocius sp.]|jgi:hypothetical protein